MLRGQKEQSKQKRAKIMDPKNFTGIFLIRSNERIEAKKKQDQMFCHGQNTKKFPIIEFASMPKISDRKTSKRAGPKNIQFSQIKTTDLFFILNFTSFLTLNCTVKFVLFIMCRFCAIAVRYFHFSLWQTVVSNINPCANSIFRYRQMKLENKENGNRKGKKCHFPMILSSKCSRKQTISFVAVQSEMKRNKKKR